LILVPVAIVLIPLIRGIPWLYSWRNRRKFYRWFGELKNLELEVMKNSELEKVMEYQGKLDQIEASINRIRVPLTLFGEVHRLKEHVDFLRGKLARSSHHSKEDKPNRET
jgi:hypothetical protein